MVQESFLRSIGSSVVWKGLDRVAGLLKHVIIAAAIGLSAQLDVFYMVTALLGVLVFSWASLMDVVAVPSMVRAWQEGREKDFKQIASGLFVITLMASLFLGAALYFFRDELAIVAVGFEPDRKKLLAEAIPWLLPVIILYVPLRLMSAILRALRQFAPAYKSDFFIALIVLVCVYQFKYDPHVLLWSFSLGVIGAFFYLFLKTWKYAISFDNPFSAALRQSLLLAPGLLVLQGAQYVYVLTERLFVSFMPTGAVSALAYAMTLTTLLPSLVALSGSFITIIAASPDSQARSSKLNDLISMAILMGLGATCFMLSAGEPLVDLLLKRGAFTVENAQSVASTMKASVWMILPLFLIGPLDQVFQVEKKIGFMVRRTVMGMFANAILGSLFLFVFKWGVIGVALATSMSYWIMLLSGLHGLESLSYRIAWLRHVKWSCWIVVCLAPFYLIFPNLFSYGASNIFSLFVCFLGVGATLLTAGMFYLGEERGLVRQTIKRVLPKVVKIN